jgi:hypothetical protein
MISAFLSRFWVTNLMEEGSSALKLVHHGTLLTPEMKVSQRPAAWKAPLYKIKGKIEK